MKLVIQHVANVVLWLEPVILVITGLAFFYPTPARTDWLWLLWLLLPVLAARYVLHGRMLTRTPLDGLFVVFLALGALNVFAAPYTRGLMMLARPVLGMAFYYALVEAARTQGNLRAVLQTMIILSLLVGLLALGSTIWPIHDKARLLRPITDFLFTIRNFPGAEAGFNSNEISGALAWLAPFTGVLMIDRWRRQETRWDVTTAFALLFAALVLAQSRIAIAGVLLSFALAALLLFSSNKWRGIALGVLAGMLMLEAGLTANVNTTSAGSPNSQTQPQTRDEGSLRTRLTIWRSSLEIVRDYPLTGVGLSMYRDGRVRAAYPVEKYENKILPHTHNEILQVATDMGAPGLVVYAGIHIVAGYMLFKIWRWGNKAARVVGVAASCGLLAHFVFGLTDAIPLWDRFAFLFWIMLGVLAAQYTTLAHHRSREDTRQQAV